MSLDKYIMYLFFVNLGFTFYKIIWSICIKVRWKSYWWAYLLLGKIMN